MRAGRVTAGIAALLAISVPEGLDSCGIAPPLPVFATRQRPADLRNQFLKGKVGVLQRSYRQEYLIGAFRMLSGVPLTDAEVASLYAPPLPGVGYIDPAERTAAWASARGQDVAAGSRFIETYKTVSTSGLIYSFANCHTDAFGKAAETLSDLRAAWGEHDPRALEWIRAQDQVFANCSGKEASIPEPSSPGMGPLLAAHRRYQIAAAYLYSGQFRRASDAFRQIADDKQSPWSGIAPYLAARALLRAGMFDGDMEAFQEGKQRLLAILDDPDQEEWHEPSLRLLHLWQLRVEPRTRLTDLGAELMQPHDDDISQSVTDLLFAVNHRQDGTSRPWSPAELTEVETGSELGAWLLAMSDVPPADAGPRSVEWWRKARNPAWLIAALANAPDRDLAELLQAGMKLPPAAPAYESVTYYAIQREAARGHEEEARRWADLALKQNLQLSSRNLILEQRSRLARNWNEFLRFGLRRPEPRVEEFDGNEIEIGRTPAPTGSAPVFDLDHIVQFNSRLPLAMWVGASGNALLPKHVQLRIAVSGWLRAVMLAKFDDARKLMRRIVELQPETAKAGSGFLSAPDAEEARFAALYLVLRVPSLLPELLDASYPTANLGEAHYVGASWYMPGEKPSAASPGFLTAAQRAEGLAEYQQLRAAEPWQSTYLLRETLNWARKRFDDPRIPEALHRAVMASRYRQNDADTGKYSQQAFVLLHRRYPK